MRGKLIAHHLGRKMDERCLHSRSQYQYHPLPSTRAVRLLVLYPTADDKISCSLKCFEPSNAPPYHALSYTWGYPLNLYHADKTWKSLRGLDILQDGADCASQSLIPDQYSLSSEQTISNNPRRFPVSCDGRTMLVTPNLRDALHMLTTADVMKRGFPNSKYIWIDAICIDQDNIFERNAQVAMMADIFGAAQSVIVWLGAEDEYTEDAFNVISRVSSLPRSSWESIKYTDFFDEQWSEKAGIGSLTLLNWLGFLAFINRSWFRRAWGKMPILEFSLSLFLIFYSCAGISACTFCNPRLWNEGHSLGQA